MKERLPRAIIITKRIHYLGPTVKVIIKIITVGDVQPGQE